MELLDICSFTSPNIYSLDQNIVLMRIKLKKLVDTPTKDISGLNEAIINLFPGLIEHKCTNGYRGGFIDRLKEGTYLAHVMEHLCLEIQAMLGRDIKYGKARNEQNDIYKIIFACENTTVGKACGLFIFDLLEKLTKQEDPQFDEGFNRLRKLNTVCDIGVSTGAIMAEAKKRGIPASEVSQSGLIRLGYGIYQRYISATLFENTSSIAVDIACDKALTKTLLREVSIPVPEGRVCYTSNEALQCVKEIGYPVVIKPKCGNKGKYVTVNITNDHDLEQAFTAALALGPEVIVEKYIIGREYRILVVNGNVIAVAERIPASVTGDGVSTLEELIIKENNNLLRGEDHEKPLTKITVDHSAVEHIKKQGMSMLTVPTKGQTVYLRTNSNLSTGGTAIDRTEEIHPRNKEIAELAVKSIGLDIAGIDMVIPEISQPITKNYGAIIEVNAAPGIRMHLNPTIGQKRDVVSPILDMIYPQGKKTSIPIIAVTGTNGKTTTARMISHILKHCSYKVGLTSTHGIYINGQCIEEGDTTGSRSAKLVLNNRQVDAAVLETARGGIVKSGLGYLRADVAVFTNLTNDHIGVDGINSMEELFHAKSLVTEAVHSEGYCVLNADDPWTLKARERAGGKIILFTSDQDNPEFIKHVQSGGWGFYNDDRAIYLTRSNKTEYVIDIDSIPAAMNGILKHNVSNSLAAIAASYAIGVSLININKSLRTFSCEPCINSGRFNVFKLKVNITVVLDYGHNYDGYRVTIEGLKKLNGTRLVGVIGVPGDRRDQDILDLGKLAGQAFDHLIIKEDKYLRDREPIEVAKLLMAGAMEGGAPRDEIKVIPAEEEALEYALINSREGDIICVFFEKMEHLIKVISEYELEHNHLTSISSIISAK